MDLLQQMATFVRVVETGSLSSAARAEKLSLAAVSRQLRALEDDLGASLVARSTRRLRITDPGRRYYEHCVRVLGEIEDARASVRSSRLVAGPLVVSAAISIGSHFVVPKIGPLVRAHPKLVVDLRLEDRVVDLVGDAVDVAIRGGVTPPDSASVVARSLLTFERVVVASPAYLRRRGTPKDPVDLGHHDCIVQQGSVDASTAWQLVRDGEARSIRIPGVVRTNAPLAILDLARQGVGVALLPRWLVDRDLAEGRLRHVLSHWCSPPITVYALYRSDLRSSPRLEAFLSALSDDGDRTASRVRAAKSVTIPRG